MHVWLHGVGYIIMRYANQIRGNDVSTLKPHLRWLLEHDWPTLMSHLKPVLIFTSFHYNNNEYNNYYLISVTIIAIYNSCRSFCCVRVTVHTHEYTIVSRVSTHWRLNITSYWFLVLTQDRLYRSCYVQWPIEMRCMGTYPGVSACPGYYGIYF